MSRNDLTEYEAGRLLSKEGIPIVNSLKCSNYKEVKNAVKKIGYPLVLKIMSPQIQHKTEAGCIVTDIKNIEQLKESYEIILSNAEDYNEEAVIKGVIVQEMIPTGLELIIGVNYDEHFEHVLMFGHGGIYVEVYEDISFRLIPLKRSEILEMIKETKVYKIIEGIRGENYNIEFLVDIIQKVAKLVEKNKDIKEIDINPFILFSDGQGGKAVDSLITFK